jgi:RimJ/RimL family protein N-acetyltransferase
MSASEIRIRPYQASDAAAVHAAIAESHRELDPWMMWCHSGLGLTDAQAWIDGQLTAFAERTVFEFAIVSADGRYLGGCGVNQVDFVNERANLGYWVRSSEAGREVATRAVRLMKDWAFRHTGLVRLEMVIAVGNGASLRVAEKAGAVREGTLRGRLLLHGVSHDAAVYSFVRPASPARPVPDGVDAFELRAAEEHDVPFLTALRRTTMFAHFENSGVRIDEVAQQARVLYRLDCARIVRVDGRDIGLLKVCRDAEPWDLVQIQLLPAYQGRGIGGALVEQVLREARAAGVGVVLDVLRANPARRLYEQFGFRIQGPAGTEYRMSVTPAEMRLP